MSRSFSNPVRTPSYRPRLDLEWIWQNAEARDDGRNTVNRFLMHLTIEHYSNGQAGCTFEGQIRDPSENRCADTALVAQPPQPNHQDGSFSVNLIGAGFEWLHMPQVSDGVAPRLWSAHAAWLFHLPLPKSGGFKGAFYDEYGWSLVTVRLEHERDRGPRAPGELLFAVQADAFPGGGPGSPPGSLMGLVARTFDILAGWGPFLRLYFGRDDYNIWFDRRITTLSAGVIWNPR